MENKIIDYISGLKIIATPEEIEATQPLSREIVEIFNYSKKDIITRPQYPIKTPGEGSTYFPDIVVKEKKKLKLFVNAKIKKFQKEKNN